MFTLLGRVSRHHGLALVRGRPQIGDGLFAKSLMPRKVLRFCSDITKLNTPAVDIHLGTSAQTQDAGKSAKAEENYPGTFDGLVDPNFFPGPEVQSESLKLAAAALKISDIPVDPNVNFCEAGNHRNAENTNENSSGESDKQNTGDEVGEQPDDQTNKLTEPDKNTLEIAALKEEVEDWRNKNLELLEKYRLALEDQKRLYGRLNKQISNAQFFGISSLCKDLLEVADALGTAASLVDLSRVDADENLKELFDNVVVAKDTLIRVFRNHGLEPIQPIHQKFDPNFHEALFQKEEADIEPDTVIEVVKLGYKLRERVIRAALVGVSKTTVVAPEQPEPKPEEKPETEPETSIPT